MNSYSIVFPSEQYTRRQKDRGVAVTIRMEKVKNDTN